VALPTLPLVKMEVWDFNGATVLQNGTVMANTDVYLEVQFGAHDCSAYKEQKDINCEPVGATEIPPLMIKVDYGDGSGTSVWTQDEPINVFQHQYTIPGTYEIFFMSTHIHDGSSVSGIHVVVVEEAVSPIFSNQTEVVCPDVVNPGQ